MVLFIETSGKLDESMLLKTKYLIHALILNYINILFKISEVQVGNTIAKDNCCIADI